MKRSIVVGAAAPLLLLTALWFCAAELPIDPLPLSDWTNGTSVFWGGPQDGQDDPFTVRLPPGACGYGEMDPKMYPFFYVAGVSPRNPLVLGRPQASCGTCLEIKCTSPDPRVCTTYPSVTVVITDECPDCAANELNLHAFAFQQIADLGYGSTSIQYRQVECSPTDNITVHVDGFRVGQGGWLRISLKSVASDGAPARVELARSLNVSVGSNSTNAAVAAGNATAAGSLHRPTSVGGSAANGDSPSTGQVWKSMDNTYGAEWELSALPAPPYDLRVTDRFGRQIILASAIVKAGALGEFPGHGQFSGLDNATIIAEASHNTSQAQGLANSVRTSLVPNPVTAPAPRPANAGSADSSVEKAPALTTKVFGRRLMQQPQQPQQQQQIVQARPVKRQMRQGTRGQVRGPMP